jgi:hypothetical protein
VGDKGKGRVLDLIAKLKAVTVENGATVDEAAAAAARMQHLVLKHNIEVAELEAAGTVEKSPYGKEWMDYGAKGVWQWRRDLGAAVAEHNFCRVAYPMGQPGLWIVGQPHNVAAVRVLYDYLAATIKRLNDEWYRDYKTNCAATGRAPENATRFQDSFCKGAAAMVAARMKEERDREAAAANSTTALIVNLDGEAERAIKDFFPDLHTHKTRGAGREDIFRAGVHAAQAISLAKQVAG